MADPLSVAGLAAGLISLSLEVTSGITQYLDALKCRSEELDTARRHNESLRIAITAIQASVVKAQSQHHAASSIVIDSIQNCEADIKSLEELVAGLTGFDTGTWRSKLRLNSLKLRYAFDRSKLQRLESQLSQAMYTVGIALQILWCNINQSIFDKTTNIELVTRDIPSNFRAIEQDVASLHPPLTRLDERSSTVEREVGHLRSSLAASDQIITAHLLESTRAIREDSKMTQSLVSVSDAGSNDLLWRIVHQNTEQRQQLHSILQIVEKPTHPTNVSGVRKKKHSRVRNHVILSSTEESSDLPHTNDTISDQSGAHGFSTSRSKRHRRTTCVPTSAMLKTSTHTTDRANTRSCICHRLNRITSQTVFRIGHFTWYSKKASHGHWPSCPQYRTASNKTWETVGMKYHGVLKRSVDLSLVLSRGGSDGPILSPNIKFRPTVDGSSDPVFRVVRLLYSALFEKAGSKTYEFILECQGRVLQAFNENTSSPFAVDLENRTIAHEFAFLLKLAWEFSPVNNENFVNNKVNLALLAFCKVLISAGVPFDTYDIKGILPVVWLFYLCPPRYPKICNAMLTADFERHHLWLDPSSAFTEGIISTFEIITSFDQFAGIAESYGCGPLSLAVSSKNLERVKDILNNYPDTINECNIAGHTPLHLAARDPSCLSLLVSAVEGSTEALNRQDNEGYTPLETAMMISRSECRGLEDDRRCSRCNCAHSVSILLKADCAVFQPKESVLNKASHRAVSRFVRHIANRRSRLGAFAAEYNGILESEHFALERSHLLDSHTSELEDILSRHIVQIPEPLRTRPTNEKGNIPSVYLYSSIYTLSLRVWQANMFWHAGFRDLNPSNRPYHVWTPLASTFVRQDLEDDYAYLDWLIAHGAHPFQPLLNTLPKGSRRVSGPRNVAGATYAHAIFFWAGEQLFKCHYYPGDPRKWIKPMQYLHMHFLHLNPADDCTCRCSKNGCTLHVQQLKGMCSQLSRRPHSETYLQQISQLIVLYVGEFARAILPKYYRDAIRFLTFTALGATHTCCDFEYFTTCYYRVTPDDRKDVQDEEQEILQTLEELVLEFEQQLLEICGTQSSVDAEQIEEFWSNHWVPRMTEVLAVLDADDISEDAKREAEDIGVVWGVEDGTDNIKYGPEAAEHTCDSPGVDKDNWDYWFNELNKIVSRDSDR